jgi:hypothetical protein
VAAEAMIRPFSSALSNDWLQITQDDPTSVRTKEIRQYSEGITTTHFSASRARLTANRWIDGAPVVVVLGDSYIEAHHVDDAKTVGSQLESIARTSGVPLNLRQYGWNGGNPATYVYFANEVRARWAGAPVIIALNDGDLGKPAFTDADRFIISSAGIRAVRTDALSAYRVRGVLDFALRHSSLLYQLGHAFLELHRSSREQDSRDQNGAGVPEQHLVDIEVDQLQRAYGSNMAIVYMPSMRDADRDRRVEKILLNSCKTFRSSCISELEPFTQAQARTGRFVLGFANTLPGYGHPNALGYGVMAEDMWKRLNIFAELRDRAQRQKVAVTDTSSH